jgi:hypothetical protein
VSEVRFSGRVERVEKDGFGIVRFDQSIDGAEYGFFTERTLNLVGILPDLRVGTPVFGTCADEGDDTRRVGWIGLAGKAGEGEDQQIGVTKYQSWR